MNSNSESRQILFNIGKINHPIYGKTEEELRGSISYLPSADTTIPQIVEINPTTIQNLTQFLFSKWHSLWEEELDDEILALVEKEILLTSFITPWRALQCSAANPRTTKEFLLIAKANLLFQVSDEIMEEMSIEAMANNLNNMTSGDSDELQMIRAVAKAIVNGINNEESGEAVEEIPSLVPRVKSMLPFITDFVRDLKDIVPDFKKDLKPFKKECERHISTTIIKAKKGEREDSGLDDYANAEQRARAVIELLAALENGKPSLEIRKSIVFKEYFASVANAHASLLAIFNLEKDICMERGEKAVILNLVLKGSLGLQDAFELYFNRAQTYLKEVCEGGNTLKATFPGDENIERFIKCCEDVVNSRIYWFARASGQVKNLK